MIWEGCQVTTPYGIRELRSLKDGDDVYSFRCCHLVRNRIFRVFHTRTTKVYNLYAGTHELLGDADQRIGETNGRIHYRQMGMVELGGMFWIVDDGQAGLQEAVAVDFRVLEDPVYLVGFKLMDEPLNMIVNGFVCKEAQ